MKLKVLSLLSLFILSACSASYGADTFLNSGSVTLTQAVPLENLRLANVAAPEVAIAPMAPLLGYLPQEPKLLPKAQYADSGTLVIGNAMPGANVANASHAPLLAYVPMELAAPAAKGCCKAPQYLDSGTITYFDYIVQ